MLNVCRQVLDLLVIEPRKVSLFEIDSSWVALTFAIGETSVVELLTGTVVVSAYDTAFTR